MPHHPTWRGPPRDVLVDPGHLTYLRLLKDNLADAQAKILAYCLMTNHVHLIATPGREDSLAVLLRRVHGRYAQYYNVRCGRSGHLWQNRFFACVLQDDHLWAALSEVERNPVRAAMTVRAGDYPWSSAAAHLGCADISGMLDMDWWRCECPENWAETIDGDDPKVVSSLRQCTYSGRPFGSEAFVNEMSVRFGRHWTRGRPRKERSTPVKTSREDQFQFPAFAD